MEISSGNKNSLRIAVATFNILHEGKYLRSEEHKDLPLSNWLFDFSQKYVLSEENAASLESPSDIYAIGFQEMDFLGSENQKAWAEELDKTLNERGYQLLKTVQMFQFYIYVYVRPELLGQIQNVETDSFMSRPAQTQAGNKGGVAIRFKLFGASLCFITSHFLHGQDEIQERYQDYALIKENILKGSAEKSDYIFWFGDLNFRIDMERELVKRLVKQEEWATLLQKDQLSLGKQAGKVFTNYQEGEIRFAPTYKYDLFSEEYDTSEKMRVPSWTDRVLWKRQGNKEEAGKCIYYGRAELKQSDHRPVLAIIKVELEN